MMRTGSVLLAIMSAAAASSIQEVLDSLFDKYLLQKVTREEVKACRSNCKEDHGCLATCPKFECPWKRITEQCDLFNSTLAKSKECHVHCGHDFACHFSCTMAKPTTMKELQVFVDSMLCHTKCHHDQACHKACHQPWHEKQARCEKLEAVVSCMRNGGSHSACPNLDEETKKGLMHEPWSLVKDLLNHAADYLLPLPEGEPSMKEVRACHVACGADVACHKHCPKGAVGLFHDKCEMLEEASTCHHACEHSETKCPFKKMECHFQCPMSMPTSVGELKGLTDHVLCHTTCGQDKMCHQTCQNSNWDEKKAQCAQYNAMVACHKACASAHSCHATCPQFNSNAFNEVKAPGGVSVLVTGASGRTGKILYKYLKADSRVGEVRALVRGSGTGSPDERKKAAAALNCSACDSSEGVYYGDVTVPSSLKAAFNGIDTVAITSAVGSAGFNNDTVTKEVEFVGVENQAAAIAASGEVSKKHIVFCSAMGTGVSPFGPAPSHGPPAFLKDIMFWKINAEAFLGASSIPNSIVKPCGLDATYGRGGKELLVGHDDKLPKNGMISREDLAAVMVEVVASRASGVRFDMCLGKGPPTTNLAELIRNAHYPWAKSDSVLFV